MIIRPMHPSEEPLVRALYAESHPNWSARPEHWYFAFPTLVAVEPVQRIVGFTGYSMNVSGENVLVMLGHDCVVSPHARGKGLGRKLMEARLEIARSLGAKLFIGACDPDNAPVQKIFEKLGAARMTDVPETDGQHYYLLNLQRL